MKITSKTWTRAKRGDPDAGPYQQKAACTPHARSYQARAGEGGRVQGKGAGEGCVGSS